MASRRTSRTLLAAGLALAVHSACDGGGPGSPSGNALPMPSGRYVLSIHGSAESGNGPTAPACPGYAAAGVADVSLELTGGVDDEAFDAGPSNPLSGSVRLHLQRGLLMTGDSGLGSIAVTGWVEGAGTHQNLPSLLGELPATQVRFDGRAGLRGEVSAGGFAGFGTVIGGVTLVSPDGIEVRCTPGTVSWALSKSAGPTASSH